MPIIIGDSVCHMKLSINHVNNICYFTLVGEIDSLSAGLIKDKIQSQIEAQCYNFIVDLTQVKFMDSAGLGVLVSGLKVCNKNGGDLVLVGLTENVRELFRITRLDTVFKLFPDRESAAEAFNVSKSD
jgi:anti-sigma B factor antagonist